MKSCARLAAASLVLFSIHSSAIAADTYKFDPAASSIQFRLHQMLGTVVGKFTKFSGKIDIDRQQPAQASVVAKIQVSSIDTGINKRDAHLKSDEFFNVVAFPEIAFKSRSVKPTGPQSADVVGDLSMHGVTKPITLHVKLTSSLGAMERTHWQVTCDPIKRRDFGLMFSQSAETVSMIGQEVTPKIEIEAVRGK